MELSKDVIKLMGQKVKYCRAKPNEKGEAELYRGNGVVVGVIIGAARRIQIMVKDAADEKNQAVSLDLLCIDPSESAAQKYFAHHKKVKALVDEHNVAQRAREAEKIKEVDDLNAEMFGAMLEV